MMRVGYVCLLCVNIAHAEWKTLASLPDKEGVAGSFAGVSNGVLLSAGGANFPDKKPWDGGNKVWYDAIAGLSKLDGEWKFMGRLPRPLGYGVTGTYRESLYIVGGSNANGHVADGYRLTYRGGDVHHAALPALPQPIANACGAVVGDHFFVVGGQAKPDGPALTKVYRLDLNAKDPHWETLADIPQARIFGTAAVIAGDLWVVGGAAVTSDRTGKTQRTYLRDAYRFDGKRWHRMTDLPYAVAAAPSPAPTDKNGFYILGGDTGDQVDVAPDKHRGFCSNILRFDLRQQKWLDSGKLPAPRVNVPCVLWNEGWVILSGEVRPGIRSPEVRWWKD